MKGTHVALLNLRLPLAALLGCAIGIESSPRCLGQVFPTILDHPQSQQISPGADLVLSVLATHTGPVAYQWRFDGKPLLGETNAVLVRGGLSPEQTGFYNVLVSGPGGTVSSSNAVITMPGDGGQISFANASGSAVHDTLGLPLNSPAGYQAQLYAGFQARAADRAGCVHANCGPPLLLTSVGNPVPIGFSPGVFFGGNVPVPVPPQAIVFLQARVWHNRYFTFEDAVSDWNSTNYVGNSQVFVLRAGGGVWPIPTTAPELIPFSLLPLTPNCLIDMADPDILTVQEGAPAELSAHARVHPDYACNPPVSGLNYRWFVNGFRIPTGFSGTLTINRASTRDAGHYEVLAWHRDDWRFSKRIELRVATPPQLEFLSRDEAGIVHLLLRARPGIYKLDTSDNLTQWNPMLTVTNQGDTTSLADPNAAGRSHRFYRALLQ